MQHKFRQLSLTFASQNLDYDKVDWDETLDVDDRELEERWFDNDSESDS